MTTPLHNREDIVNHCGPHSISNWPHWQSGLAMDKLVSRFKPQNFVELGSLESYLCELLLRRFPHLKVIAIDTHFLRPNLWKKYDNFFQINHDTASAARLFEDESLDFIYQDASHSYNGVKRDIDAWYPKLKKGGILAGHDYDNPDFPGVNRAIDELVSSQQLELNVEAYWNFWLIKQ